MSESLWIVDSSISFITETLDDITKYLEENNYELCKKPDDTNAFFLVYTGAWYHYDYFKAFKVISEFVKTNSFIEFACGDGDSWRIMFKNGKGYKIKPIITWPEPTEKDELLH